MKTPYEILDVSADAGDVEIERAYRQKVKEYPPENKPVQFRVINQAYESIKDRKCRISYELFSSPDADFSELLDRALSVPPISSLTPEQFDKLLHAGVNALLDTDS